MLPCVPLVPPVPCAARSTGIGNLAITGLIEALLVSYCSIASFYLWPPDAGENYISKGRETFDFIIVGGGAAGSVIAGRLSENLNYRVLLIEAGDNPPVESTIPGLSMAMVGTKFDWSYETESNGLSCRGSPGGACQWISGKALGGSSAINLMVAVRGNRRDFDVWEEMGNPTWGWNSVLPYFKKTEDYRGPNPGFYHGIGGPLAVSRIVSLPSVTELLLTAAKQSGLGVVDDFRDEQFLGFGPLDLIQKGQKRNTPATAFLLKPSANLHIIKNAVVSKINFDKYRRARSVTFTYTNNNNKTYELEALNSKEIIISAGSVGSPKLLQLSGIGPSKLLKSHGIPVLSDMPVGENLQDHTSLLLFFECNVDEHTNITDTTFNYFINHNDSFASLNMVNIITFLDIGKESGKYPNIQLHYRWYPKGYSADQIIDIPTTIRKALNQILETSALLAMNIVVLKPKSRGSIKIKSPDYRDKPIIEPNYLSHIEDVNLHIKTIRALIELENTPVFKKNGIKHLEIPIPGCEHLAKGCDEYWECYTRFASNSLSHSTSTVKMGAYVDPEAIVDPQLKVKSIKRLRVADASIMPMVPSANPMMTTIMIGEKAADFIKEDWKSNA